MLTLVLAALLKLKAVVLLPLEDGPNLLRQHRGEKRERERKGKGTQKQRIRTCHIQGRHHMYGGIYCLGTESPEVHREGERE